MWLELARRRAEHIPALDDAGLVAERAAGHPAGPDALLLAAQLAARPAAAWYGEGVRRPARTLPEAAAALPGAERPSAVEELRQALVNAGDVDAVPF